MKKVYIIKGVILFLGSISQAGLFTQFLDHVEGAGAQIEEARKALEKASDSVNQAKGEMRKIALKSSDELYGKEFALTYLEQVGLTDPNEVLSGGPIKHEILNSAGRTKEIYKFILGEDQKEGEITALISRPLDGGSYPTLFVFAGAEVRKETVLSLLTNNSAVNPKINLVIYDYQNPEIKNDLPTIAKTTEKVLLSYARMMLLMEWTSRQTWADKNQLHALGVSFGAVVLPFSLTLLRERHHISLNSVVFAYAGANLLNENKASIDGKKVEFQSFLNNLGVVGKVDWSDFDNFTKAITEGFDPKHHLKYMNSEKVLVVGGTNDQIFSQQSTENFFNYVGSNNKELKWIRGQHIDLNQTQLIGELKSIVNTFLGI